MKRINTSAKTYTITEYGGFVRNKPPFDGYQSLPGHTFDALENFILANSENDIESSGLLSLSVRRGMGKIITARNYVGLITMKDGIVIEILPKIYGDSINETDTKRIFLEMLRTLKNTSFKDFSVSNLKTDRLSLFEIFIAMFVAETTILVKQGLKSSYNPVETNERFFRGKLNVMQNIKHNYVTRERFFVEYDEWSIDRPENRLIKETLRFLQTLTQNDRNRQNISRLLISFEDVDSSTDYRTDFSKCTADRSMSHYAKALSWCRVFLLGNSFTAFAGSEIAIALLFPMEKIFESYIAARLRYHLSSDVEMRTQDMQHSLFDHPKKTFSLRPDIVLKNGNKTIVMDTKWKLLSENIKNYGISHSDMYQMYVYGKKYDAEKIVVLYPQTVSLRGKDISFHSDDGVKVEVSFIDLLHTDDTMSTLVKLTLAGGET